MSQGEPGVLRVVGPQAPMGQKGPRVLGNEGAEGRTAGEGTPVADDLAALGEGLPSPGRYIREQRQRRGMSVEQLAAATKIPRTSVVLLEEDRFDELPGPVFVKGFLRCSARALGVDADAVMELLYERERAQLNSRRRDRPSSATRPTGAAAIRPSTRPTGAATRPTGAAATRPTGAAATRPTGAAATRRGGAAAGSRAAARPDAAATAAPSPRDPTGDASAALATTDGVVPRMPPRIRKQQAPVRSASGMRAVLTRIPSVSVLLWIVIAVLVAMVVMAAFNLVGQATTAAGA